MDRTRTRATVNKLFWTTPQKIYMNAAQPWFRPVQVKECARRAAIQKREAVAAANRVAAQEKEAAVAAALAEATAIASAREIEAAMRLRPELSRGRERGASRLASSRAGVRCK